jgi:hypothetical protein
MRLGLAAWLLALACAPTPAAEPAKAGRAPARAPDPSARCRSALDAIAETLGQALDERLEGARSNEEAALALLELTPGEPRSRALVEMALTERDLTHEAFGRCLQRDPGARQAFEDHLHARIEGARARARALPELSASSEGCRRLLPLMVTAKEQQALPIALGAHLILPCAGKVSERELRCAIAEGTLEHFQACQRGERDPPPSSRETPSPGG